LGLRALGGRLIKWRTGIRWYALALLIAPMAMVVVPLAISAFYPAMMPRVFTSNDRASLFAIGIASGLLGGLLEELGWTGFATPQLLKRHGVLEAGLILGPIWALWHLPMNLWSSGDATGALATTLFLHSFLFSIGILTAYRILIVWVYQGTRSLLVAVLMHFALILGNLLFVPEAFDALPGPVWSLAVAATLWVMLAVVRVGRRAGRPAAGRPVAA
jgi:membrane protease YdiL (CAAX protease family)